MNQPNSSFDGLFSVARSIRKNMKGGNVGVIVARAGIGKSASLVQIAMSELVLGRAALHISQGDPVVRVRRFYDELIHNIERRKGDPEYDLRLHIEQFRHIHSYLDQSFSAEKLTRSLNFLHKYMDLNPKLVVIDDFPFADSQPERLQELKKTAEETQTEIWLSALAHRHIWEKQSDTELPAPLQDFSDSLDSVISLVPQRTGINIQQWTPKNQQWSLLEESLNPKTLLLQFEEESA